MENDLADESAIVEDRARRICATLNVDPDEVLDPYGPVRRWDAVAYHISEAIEALRRPVPADVAGVAVKAFSADPHNPATLRVHFAQPVTPADRNSLMAAINRFNSSARCSLGVGCDEAGICYAAAHSQPEQCGSHEITLASGRDEVLARANAAHWFYYGDDCSSDQCRDSIDECIQEDFEWGNKQEGDHVLQISGARPVPDMWIALHYFTNAEKDAREDDEPYEFTVYASEEEARNSLSTPPQGDQQ